MYGIVRQPPWARFVPGWPHAAHTAKPPPVGATGAPGTAPERRRIPVRCAETPAIDFLARGSYTPRRFKPHDAHRGRPGGPGGLFLAKNVRLYHNLMFFTPWGPAGRQNSLSFFDEFGCTILAPGKNKNYRESAFSGRNSPPWLSRILPRCHVVYGEGS